MSPIRRIGCTLTLVTEVFFFTEYHYDLGFNATISEFHHDPCRSTIYRSFVGPHALIVSYAGALEEPHISMESVQFCIVSFLPFTPYSSLCGALDLDQLRSAWQNIGSLSDLESRVVSIHSLLTSRGATSICGIADKREGHRAN